MRQNFSLPIYLQLFYLLKQSPSSTYFLESFSVFLFETNGATLHEALFSILMELYTFGRKYFFILMNQDFIFYWFDNQQLFQTFKECFSFSMNQKIP